MLADLLKAVVALVDEKNNEKNKNLQPVKFSLPEIKNKVFYVHKGEIVEKDVDHPDRLESVSSVDSFIDLLKNSGANEADAEKRIAVWLVDGEARAVLDNNEYRRNTACLDLERLPLFSLIESMGGYGLRVKQDEMIRLLRLDLRQSPDKDAVLLAVRSVKFATNEQTQSTQNRNDDSLGVSVHQQVAFAEGIDLPETMRISTPVYFDPKQENDPHTFEIMLDVDITEKKFILRVPRDVIDRAIYEELDTIKSSIESQFSRVPVYFAGDDRS